jgi:hypothetical protein
MHRAGGAYRRAQSAGAVRGNGGAAGVHMSVSKPLEQQRPGPAGKPRPQSALTLSGRAAPSSNAARARPASARPASSSIPPPPPPKQHGRPLPTFAPAAAGWVFNSAHDALMSNLQHQAPADLQVWARRRKQAAQKQLMQRGRAQSARRERDLAPPPWQRSSLMPAPMLREPMRPLSIMPQAQRLVLQHSAYKPKPSNLKNPLRSATAARHRMLQRELEQQRRLAQRQLVLSQQDLKERSEPAGAAKAASAATVQLKPTTTQIQPPPRSTAQQASQGSKQHLEMRLSEFQEERLNDRSTVLYNAVHAPRGAPAAGPSESTVSIIVPGASSRFTFRAFALDGGELPERVGKPPPPPPPLVATTSVPPPTSPGRPQSGPTARGAVGGMSPGRPNSASPSLKIVTTALDANGEKSVGLMPELQ